MCDNISIKKDYQIKNLKTKALQAAITILKYWTYI